VSHVSASDHPPPTSAIHERVEDDIDTSSTTFFWSATLPTKPSLLTKPTLLVSPSAAIVNVEILVSSIPLCLWW
jgi:hypothetical protein